MRNEALAAVGGHRHGRVPALRDDVSRRRAEHHGIHDVRGADRLEAVEIRAQGAAGWRAHCCASSSERHGATGRDGPGRAQALARQRALLGSSAPQGLAQAAEGSRCVDWESPARTAPVPRSGDAPVPVRQRAVRSRRVYAASRRSRSLIMIGPDLYAVTSLQHLQNLSRISGAAVVTVDGATRREARRPRASDCGRRRVRRVPHRRRAPRRPRGPPLHVTQRGQGAA